jgi:predicted MFS family arabinose efflux permease
MENKDRNKMLWILSSMAFLANGDTYAAASLIPNIANSLNLSVSTAALSVTSYMLAFGAFTLLFGPLSDRFGKATVINIAAIGTSIFSILGATAFNLQSLVLFRAMNGLFGAGIFPVTLALVGERFDTEHRQKAIGTVMGMAFLGAASASAIGGALAYVGSWRLVYLIYGVAELVLALTMLKTLERDVPRSTTFNLFASYKVALTNFRFMRLVTLLFFVGFSVLGSFTFSGILLKETTGLNTLFIGLILSLFGIGTVLGGRIAPAVRSKMKGGFLVFAGMLGSFSLYSLAVSEIVFIQALSLLFFGIAFIFLQSTLIATAQEKLSSMKGTVMSLAGFNMFLGGALGTFANGIIMKSYEIQTIFFNSAGIMVVVGLFAALFVARFEMRKQRAMCKQRV